MPSIFLQQPYVGEWSAVEHQQISETRLEEGARVNIEHNQPQNHIAFFNTL